MSALDQAFIEAYAKVGSAPAVTGSAQGATAQPRPAVASRPDRKRTARPSAASHIDSLYADGVLYRLEVPVIADEPSVPPPHYAPPSSQQRTMQRRIAGRYRTAIEPQIEIAPAPTERPAPRRMPTRSLTEIARRLAHYIPPAPTAELPPEVLVVEEPEEKPVAPSTEPIPELKPAAHVPATGKPSGGAPAAPPTDVSKASVTAAWSSPSPAPVAREETTPVEDVATLVEVCTPWEPINDAVSAAMVILTDTPASPIALPQALVNVALDPIIERGARSAAELPDEVEQISARPPLAGAARTAAPSDAADIGRTYRIDPTQGQRIDAPHFAIVRDAGAEPPQAKTSLPPASEPAEVSRAKLTPDEMASLIGTLAPEQTALAAPPQLAVDAANVPTAGEPLVPMWEVDRFQWPSICDRLLRDEQSYFAQAGGKLLAAAKDGLKILGITGSRRGEGRTTLALCLARCAAQSGLNVAMIDADFTRPQLAAVIGLEVAYGWQDAAQGKIPLAEAAVKSLADKITVLPLEASSVAWPLSLADKRVSATIRTVAQAHDLVIVDLGPLSGGSEPVFAADEAAPLDAVIVLRDLRYATPAETQAIGQRLHESGLEAIGIAENFVASGKKSAG